MKKCIVLFLLLITCFSANAAQSKFSKECDRFWFNALFGDAIREQQAKAQQEYLAKQWDEQYRLRRSIITGQNPYRPQVEKPVQKEPKKPSYLTPDGQYVFRCENCGIYMKNTRDFVSRNYACKCPKCMHKQVVIDAIVTQMAVTGFSNHDIKMVAEDLTHLQMQNKNSAKCGYVYSL